MGRQQIKRTGGFRLISKGKSTAQPAKIGPALEACSQEAEWAVTRTGLQVDLQAWDGLNSGLFAGSGKFDRPGQQTVIGES